MKIARYTLILITLLMGLTQLSFARLRSNAFSDDRTLGRPPRILPFQVPLELQPDSAEIAPNSQNNGLIVQFLRFSRGRWVGVEGLRLQLSTPNSEKIITDSSGIAHYTSCQSLKHRFSAVTFKAQLEDNYFVVTQDNRTPYFLNRTVPCNSILTLGFKEDSPSGQALGIWEIVRMTEHKLATSVGLEFIKSKIPMNWPSSGNYYSWGSVYLTEGHAWDIVGHELGHAIYDQAGLGQFGSGTHKIDECYDERLALSEGWATYFSGWLSLALDDPDARFQYLVPRRAPIRIENVPNDVCRGPRNEWRVSSFLWDLTDVHQDGESVSESFVRFWNALAKSEVGSISEAAMRFEKSGISRQQIQSVWKLNFSD